MNSAVSTLKRRPCAYSIVLTAAKASDLVPDDVKVLGNIRDEKLIVYRTVLFLL